jgi:hypothetical protein
MPTLIAEVSGFAQILALSISGFCLIINRKFFMHEALKELFLVMKPMMQQSEVQDPN